MSGPTKERFLAAFSAEMELPKSVFKKIYGYEISFPGFAERALSRLESLECGGARESYDHFVNEYEDRRREEMKSVARWYQDWYDGQYERKGGDELRERTELQKMSDADLIELLESLTDGI